MGGLQVNNTLLGITKSHDPFSQPGSIGGMQDIDLNDKAPTPEAKTKNVFRQITDNLQELGSTLFQKTAKTNIPHDVKATSLESVLKEPKRMMSQAIQKVHTFIENLHKKPDRKPDKNEDQKPPTSPGIDLENPDLMLRNAYIGNKPELKPTPSNDIELSEGRAFNYSAREISAHWTAGVQTVDEENSFPGSIADILAKGDK